MKKADAIWNSGPELMDDDGELRELTKEDFAQFRPFSELPADLQGKLLAINRGPVTYRSVPDEKPATLTLAPDLAKELASTGEGWEARVDEVLRVWVETQKAS